MVLSSRNTDLKPKDAVKLADIIIISVPIRHTVQVIQELIEYLPDDRLLMDFTGIKTEATCALAGYTRGEVVATHPMFGPWVQGLQGQNIAYDALNPWEKWQKIYDLWQQDWANLIPIESKKHDEMVSIIQSTVHILNLVLGHILKQRGINIEDLMKISTPNARMQLCILSRFFKQEASLYTDMQVYNPLYQQQILPEIEAYFKNLEGIIDEKNTTQFETEFESIKAYLWSDFIENNFHITKQMDAFLKQTG